MFKDTVLQQHILPDKSIGRFCSGDPPKVQVLLLQHEKLLPLGSKSGPFYVTRKWDEGIERDAIPFETEFQILADRICQDLTVLDGAHWRTINNFYAILSERSRARYIKLPMESRLENLSPGSSLSKNELDDFERKGIFLSGDPAQIDRAVFGLAQRLSLSVAQRENPAWGIATATNREFLVSDCFHRTPRIPVSPKIYLVREDLWLDSGSKRMTEDQVVFFNQDVSREAQQSIFARDLENAGLVIERKPAQS